jgi:DNA-binding response OmpR family regulator
MINMTNHQGDFSKGCLLFLDDDTDTCEMMTMVLKQAGYDVITGNTVAEGMELIGSKQFDMILLDWQFEDGTGLELCQKVRQTDKYTPIFFYTGMAYEHHIKSALRAGAQGCFIKPVEVDAMMKTISSYISMVKPVRDKSGS